MKCLARVPDENTVRNFSSGCFHIFHIFHTEILHGTKFHHYTKFYMASGMKMW